MLVIKGSLLDAPEQYIAHQCNSVSNQAGGLAYHLFNCFPHADIYSHRPYPYKAKGDDLPGNIIVRGDGKKDRHVINMIAQYYPGEPSSDSSLIDSAKIREGYFWQCLLKISRIEELYSIAFPYGIGCGLAGGNWDNYHRMLKNFSLLDEVRDTKVCVYNLAGA
jgi:O-acetyl-ADP-ribose deacetylase (regulator of RNase III)